MLHRRYTMTVATSALFLVCILLHAQTGASAQGALPYTDAEAYRIYDALLPDDWTVVAAHAQHLLIQSETNSVAFCLKPASGSAAVLQPVFDRFVELNKTHWLLQPSLRLDRPYDFVGRQAIVALFEPGGPGWQGLRARYPDAAGSYITLSPVAFNADKTIAVVYMDHNCGARCGGGTFHVLKKKDGVWKNLKWSGTSCAWAS